LTGDVLLALAPELVRALCHHAGDPTTGDLCTIADLTINELRDPFSRTFIVDIEIFMYVSWYQYFHKKSSNI